MTQHPAMRIETLSIGKGRDRRDHDFPRAPTWQDYGFESLAAFQEWAAQGGGPQWREGRSDEQHGDQHDGTDEARQTAA